MAAAISISNRAGVRQPLPIGSAVSLTVSERAVIGCEFSGAAILTGLGPFGGFNNRRKQLTSMQKLES